MILNQIKLTYTKSIDGVPRDEPIYLDVERIHAFANGLVYYESDDLSMIEVNESGMIIERRIKKKFQELHAQGNKLEADGQLDPDDEKGDNN